MVHLADGFLLLHTAPYMCKCQIIIIVKAANNKYIQYTIVCNILTKCLNMDCVLSFTLPFEFANRNTYTHTEASIDRKVGLAIVKQQATVRKNL